ncbi:ATP-binding cassette domain-containing protein [Auraticoccus sp. F435]|uniref:ATP-binding cassette domain-containing protein n=1 Tax=Auraticoccus cholistanensis TaxID=2656650 RepID=A0A6A9UUF3_9ACTN|nr:ABC transporter ATP-binding protein [Auraticoccus cholistanensis]MVA74837.1 ATP-binding cassette domain-containing protein [Auraticoccus cholistanensis]
MPLFPPRVRAYAEDATEFPDTRSPSAFLLWMIRSQWRIYLAMVGIGVLWFLPGAVGPYFLGRAIDSGVSSGDWSAVVMWSSALLGVLVLGVVAGIVGHSLEVASWLVALYGTVMRVTRKSVQMGHVLPRRTPTGEVLSVSASDSDTFGATLNVVARATSGALAFLVVAALVLSTSVPLGLVVLLAGPVLVGAAAPLLRPLHRAQAVERNRISELTSMATDIVAGLRILRGIGGEATFGRNYTQQSQRARQAGVRAGRWQAAVDALGVLLSGLFLVTLTWLGARELVAGRISIGQLISFFGYAVFVVLPIQLFFEAVRAWVQGLVSARKATAVLGLQPPWQEPESPAAIPAGAELVDERSGVRIPAGRLVVVVSGVPDDSAALADRLGRYLPDTGTPPSLDVDESLKGRARREAKAEMQRLRRERAVEDEVRARARWGVTLGGVDLSQLPVAELRRHVLVSDAASAVFAGTLQQAVDPHRRATREQAERALDAASGEDVYTALPGGWQGVLDERGRGLSGGQRQRLVLARALLADPPVLVLVEPTSAVDAHTEARIAARVPELRRGRTTVVMTVSPLWLHHADEVIWLEDGRLAGQGSHTDLLAERGYRDVVARGMEVSDV